MTIAPAIPIKGEFTKVCNEARVWSVARGRREG
jgi:hypothetical protein